MREYEIDVRQHQSVSNAGQSWFVPTSNQQKFEIVLDCAENVVFTFLNLAVTFGCLSVDADRSRKACYSMPSFL